MSSYRILPSGVQDVLTSTQAEAQKLGPMLTPLQGWVESAVEATGGSGAVAPALQAFFQNQGAHLESITRRVEAGLTGAYNATTAYVEGDLEMVADYQSAAARSANPTPGPFGRGPRAE
jgi:hypothetical protein